MLQPKPLIQLKSKDAIRVGKIWLFADQLPDALARFTRLVFCLTSSLDYPYSFRGSATSIRWQGNHLAFLCKHQIKGFAPRDIVVPIDRDGKILVSGSTFIEIIPSQENEGEEFGDLCAMHFRPADYKGANFDRAFFEMKEADNWNGDIDSTFLIYGYPTDLRDLEHAAPSYALSHIKVKQIVTSARYVQASSAIGVHQIEMKRNGTYSSDGLSGGPVFQLGEDAQGFFCGFAGVVLRGSPTSNFLHFLDVRLIMQFVRKQAA